MLQSREYVSVFPRPSGPKLPQPLRGRDGVNLQSLIRISPRPQVKSRRVEPLP